MLRREQEDDVNLAVTSVDSGLVLMFLILCSTFSPLSLVTCSEICSSDDSENELDISFEKSEKKGDWSEEMI